MLVIVLQIEGVHSFLYAMKILDNNFNKVVKYTYDSWENKKECHIGKNENI